MRKRTIRSTALLGLVMTLAVAACNPASAPAQSQAVAGATGTPAGSSGGGGPSGKPIVVGSTLSLTGPLAATGKIHKIAGDLFVAQLNASGGLLGRPVKWEVLDDQSDQSKVAGLYEQLISQDHVDLLMGPYATPNILSAMAVAERHGFVLPQHTAVLAPLMTYNCQFPGWSIGPDPNVFIPNQVLDAVASVGSKAPKSVAFVTNAGGSTDFISHGSSKDPNSQGFVSIAKSRGLNVVLDVKYPAGTTDWAPIAAQVKSAAPDLLVMDSLGVEPVDLINAMSQLSYRPPMMFSLFPAPGPLLGLGDKSNGMLSVSQFEPNASILSKMPANVRATVDAYTAAAQAAGVKYTTFETQAAASWTAWQILVDGVKQANSLDQQQICDALHKNGADTTFNGHLTFDPAKHNFWAPTEVLKQIQNKDWVVVWPKDRAAAPLLGPQS